MAAEKPGATVPAVDLKILVAAIDTLPCEAGIDLATLVITSLSIHENRIRATIRTSGGTVLRWDPYMASWIVLE